MTLSPTAVLAYAGRHGPIFLFLGALVGLIAPPLAEAARPLLGFAVFLFTLGAFLKVDGPAFRLELHAPARLGAALLWATFGVPLAALGLTWLLQPDRAIEQGFLLCMLAPPTGSAAAVAAMLGLEAPLALFATVAATALSPFYLPPLAAAWTGQALHIDPLAMAVRLGVIVGGAALSAALLRRCAGRFVSANPHAMTGVAVVGLILVAIGAMRGMQEIVLSRPAQVIAWLALAFAVNAGFQIIGAALFAAGGRARALTVGLVSGNRNVTLAWAAADAALAHHPEVELYFAVSVLPIFMLPALSEAIVRRLLRGEARSRAANQPSQA